MDLFDLAAKITLDSTEYEQAIKKVASSSESVKSALEAASTPIDKLKGALNSLSHPVETVKAGWNSLKDAASSLAHPIDTVKSKIAESATEAQKQQSIMTDLANSYEKARGKVAALTEEYKNSVKESGTGSESSVKLAKAIDEAEQEAKEAEKAMADYANKINDVGAESDNASEKQHKFAEMLKSGIGTAAKVGGAAVAAAGAVVGKVVKDSVEAYGEYEQLVGGVETLFGDSADKVLSHAQDAYKTAGMSMNKYMETSIQSAASLINSLGGDQEKASQLMDMSITDMSDNVNKMGTTMEAVQNAYRGFSRGNFTMLDNLALGFAGTKEGMQDLLDKAQEISGVKYDISSYADMVEAIHVVQTEMGISGISAEEAAKLVAEGVLTEEEALQKMGTTAKEAATTIQGSLGSAKAAWSNLITGLGDKNADIGKLVDNMIYSASTALKNIIPVVKQALSGIGKAIAAIAPVIGDTLSGLITDVLPDLVESAINLVKGIADALLNNVGTIVDAAFQIINILVSTFSDSSTLGKIGGFAADLLLTLSTGLAENLPTILPAITEIIMQLMNVFTDPENIGNMVEASIAILMALADGLIASVGVIAERAPEIMENIVIALVNAAPDLAAAGLQLLQKLGQGLLDAGGALLDYFAQLFEPVTTWMSETWETITQPIQDAWDKVLEIISPILEALQEMFQVFGEIAAQIWEEIKAAVETAVTAIATALEPFKAKIDELKSKFEEFRDKVKTVFEEIQAAIKEKIDAALQWGEDLLKNLAQGIANGIHWVTDKVKEVAGVIWSWLHQTTADVGPLKYTDLWGGDLMDNIINGIESRRGELEKTIKGVAESMNIPDFVSDPETFTYSSSDDGGYETESITMESNDATADKLDEILGLLEEYLPEILNRPIELDGDIVSEKVDSRLGAVAAMKARV